MRPDEKSRPTKSVFIEIDVPAEASAAVAYRLRPDKFEIERIPAKNDMDETHIQGQSAMATAAWSGVGVFLFLWLVTSTGFLGSSLFGFFVAAFIWNQNKGGAKSMPGTAPAQANEVASNNS